MLNGGNAVSTIGRQGAGPGHFAVVPRDGVRVQFRGAVLRGTGVDDSHRGQRVHVRLCHPRRDLRLDHRLGSDPRIRGLEHGGGGGILRLFQRSAGRRLPLSSAEGHRQPGDCGRRAYRERVQRPGAGDPADPDLDSGARRARERADEQRHGRDQNRGDSDFRDRRGARGEHRQLASVSAPRLFRAC